MHPFSCKGQPDLVAEEQREPRKRGSDRETRGVSNEQVCVLTATDSSDALLFRVAKRGRLDTESAKRELGPRIRKKPVHRDILVTDSQKAYNGIAEEKNLIHKAIPTGEYATADRFNIQKNQFAPFKTRQMDGTVQRSFIQISPELYELFCHP